MNFRVQRRAKSDDPAFARCRHRHRAVTDFSRSEQRRRCATRFGLDLDAIDRLQEFPALGMPTEDAHIRQIVIRFGASGYIVRYAILAETTDILVTRIWHGRESRL
jgi:toxin ParE1/3/4